MWYYDILSFIFSSQNTINFDQSDFWMSFEFKVIKYVYTKSTDNIFSSFGLLKVIARTWIWSSFMFKKQWIEFRTWIYCLDNSAILMILTEFFKYYVNIM